MAKQKKSSKRPDSRPARSRYKSEGHEKRNRELKAAKHRRKINKQVELSEERLALVDSCKAKLGYGSVRLQRLIGTLNIRRLSEVMNDTYLDADWFKDRQKRKEAKNEIQRPKKREKSKKLRKFFQKKANKVPKGGIGRDTEVSENEE